MRTSGVFILVTLVLFTTALLSFSLAPLYSRTRFSYKPSLLRLFDPAPPHTFPFETFSISRLLAKYPEDRQFAQNLSAFLDIIITQYTTWHRQQRLLCEADAAHARSLPILVLRNSHRGGVGDRVRAILYNYLVAVASNRFFLIDWQQPLPITKVFHSPPMYNFTYDAMLFTTSSDDEHVIHGPSHFKNLDIYFSPTGLMVNEDLNTFSMELFFDIYDRYPELNLTRKIVHAGLKEFRVLREKVAPFLLKALFESEQSVRSLLGELRPFNGQPFISLHARLGHGVNEKSGRFNFTEQGLTLQGVSACIGALAAMRAQQYGRDRVYVVTDTPHARKFIETGVRAVLPRADVAHSPINATHITVLHGDKLFPDEEVRHRKFEEVFVDIGLLSMAESLVFFPSGFPVVATWFGAIADSVMIDYKDCIQLREDKVNGTDFFSQRLLHLRI